MEFRVCCRFGLECLGSSTRSHRCVGDSGKKTKGQEIQNKARSIMVWCADFCLRLELN